MRSLLLAIALVALPANAYAGFQQWSPWSNPDQPDLVGADFTHDDGGRLLILCNKTKNLISYVFKETRASDAAEDCRRRREHGKPSPALKWPKDFH
jgi:hypothetical protein